MEFGVLKIHAMQPLSLQRYIKMLGKDAYVALLSKNRS